MRRRVKSASKKMAQSVRMRRGAPAKKKTQKAKKPGNDWYKQVTAVFKEMRQKDPNVKLQDAMKEASRRKKQGLLLSPVRSAASSEFSIVSAPKKKKALSPVKSAASSEFSVVSAPKPKKKAKKTKKKKMTPPPIPPNKKGKKLASKKGKKSSKKNWKEKYDSKGNLEINNPLNSDYGTQSGTE